MGNYDVILMSTKIKNIIGYMQLDSRANPTVGAKVILEDNSIGISTVPSGASTGIYEAVELRDKEKAFKGFGVKKAVENINKKILPALKGMDALDQNLIDKKMIELDGSENKSNLGANAILAVSLSVCRVAAASKNVEVWQHVNELVSEMSKKKSQGVLLPTPMSNVINGGVHAGNDLKIQEFMIMPTEFTNYSEAVQAVCETYHVLKGVLKKKYGPTAINVGDEGGFAPNLSITSEALELLLSSIEEAGYTNKIKLAMDPAASEFYDKGTYTIDGKKLTPGELCDFYVDLVKKYPIVSIEDGFEENDFETTAELTKKVNIQIVGDDLFVTNTKRLLNGIEKKAANALLLKVNQIGSLTESIDAALLSLKNNYGVVVSHRSGESEDSFIADLAVGLGCGQIKTGAPARSERTCKYNRLLRIESTQKPLYGKENIRSVFQSMWK